MPLKLFAAGDDVNNGGGVAERTILYAYSKLESYIKLCVTSETCKLKTTESELLNKILIALPEEYASSEQIRFASEKESPGTFLINGEIKAAKTGNKIGSPIYFNRDLFSAKSIHNIFEPISLSSAVSLLVHELGHHHLSKFQEADLDLLGVKVSLLLDQEINQTPVFPNNHEINAIIINDKVTTFYPEVLLYIGDEVYDISTKFKEALFCGRMQLPDPLPDPETPMPLKKPLKVTYYNIHWDTFSEANGQGVFQILGNLILDCGGENTDKSNQAKISFNVRRENNKWKLVDKSISAQQYYKPWWKIINLPFFDSNF
jgi:hypothetical protein